jgi:hypothetical protein
MTFLRQKMLAWSHISTSLLLTLLASCGLLSSLAVLHRLARHPVVDSLSAALSPAGYHFAWVWSGRFFVLCVIASAALLAHGLARLCQHSLASLRQN